MFLYFCSVLRKKHNILFAQSPLELRPREVNEHIYQQSCLCYKRRLPIVGKGCRKPQWRMEKSCAFSMLVG